MRKGGIGIVDLDAVFDGITTVWVADIETEERLVGVRPSGFSNIAGASGFTLRQACWRIWGLAESIDVVAIVGVVGR
jgi:hypothetical protein